ncbi:hypothetical protein DPMN_082382 [Dreissena polymorpha]|uniref:Uncharacterized protein n=1 Tax=Dreissena polymorpha TaxID=45954 RepID=A0A9D3YAP3_DREPO|nr:hypothetical protein DPMN_082382 [Dreissena polymorpha]
MRLYYNRCYKQQSVQEYRTRNSTRYDCTTTDVSSSKVCKSTGRAIVPDTTVLQQMLQAAKCARVPDAQKLRIRLY